VRADRETILNFVEWALESILTDFEVLPSSHHDRDEEMFGALTPQGECFETAQRLRALVSALSFLPRTASDEQRSSGNNDVLSSRLLLRSRVERAANKATEYLSSLQVQSPDNPCRGGFMRAKSKRQARFPWQEEPNQHVDDVRMDFVADAMVALIGERRSLLDKYVSA